MFFALIPSAIVTLLAFAVLRALSPQVRTRMGSAIYWIAAAAILGALSLAGRGSVGSLGAGVKFVASMWIVTTLMTVLVGSPVVAIRWIVRRIHRHRSPSPVAEIDSSRRRFLQGATVPAVALATSAAGAIGARGFVIRHEEVRVSGLPTALDGFRIGHFTDVHVGAFIDPIYLQRVMDALNGSQVDLQVMTGDLVDHASLVAPVFEQLDRCRSPLGMIAVLGNHDKRRGLESVVATAYDRAAQRGVVRLLVDQSTVVEHNGARMRVVGVDYPMSRTGGHAPAKAQREASMRASADRAFAEATPGETTLCLSHHPDFFPFAQERGACLTLAGHTHGGQVAFWGKPLINFFRYVLGRYRLGAAHLYVSAGAGHWLAFRLGVPAEIAILTLRSGP
jgi:predicted MPP superfamily phosphohydrolase